MERRRWWKIGGAHIFSPLTHQNSVSTIWRENIGERNNCNQWLNYRLPLTCCMCWLLFLFWVGWGLWCFFCFALILFFFFFFFWYKWCEIFLKTFFLHDFSFFNKFRWLSFLLVVMSMMGQIKNNNKLPLKIYCKIIVKIFYPLIMLVALQLTPVLLGLAFAYLSIECTSHWVPVSSTNNGGPFPPRQA